MAFISVMGTYPGKPRVYVSKSKEADPQVVKMTLRYLDSLEYNVFVYPGNSTYNLSDLDKMDLMFLIGPAGTANNPCISDSYPILTIGRGQYSELEYYRAYEGGFHIEEIFFVTDVNGGLYVDEVQDFETIPSSVEDIVNHGSYSSIESWKKYGKVFLNGAQIEYTNYMGKDSPRYIEFCETNGRKNEVNEKPKFLFHLGLLTPI